MENHCPNALSPPTRLRKHFAERPDTPHLAIAGPNGIPRPTFGAINPLQYDLVVIDGVQCLRHL